MEDFIDKHTYFFAYCLGFITIALLDQTAITENIWLFLLISPLLATFTGFIAFFAIAIPLGIILYLSDFIRFIYKKIKLS